MEVDEATDRSYSTSMATSMEKITFRGHWWKLPWMDVGGSLRGRKVGGSFYRFSFTYSEVWEIPFHGSWWHGS